MTPIGTRRVYRPDPRSIGVSEQWGPASASVALEPAVVVSILGEVDASNAGRLAGYLERHVAIATALVVDATAVDFFGAPAMAALHGVDRCCAALGIRWRLVPGPAVRRVLRVCASTDLPRAETVRLALVELGVAFEAPAAADSVVVG
ncbi:STAS domain-containing protein [Mycobacterium yunnanensis]|uniref:STAS domain-containing protein n=1 Tax=Mycobacterium yunnanensis TaxID=368477 RepID=A0A9X3BZT7_9MYCO|nr:STAS domain-containing protein [Mycobacterium yunnanensis]MCV7419211.1 STAS domain-containing protein [Mycobacterium yunnanensis]